MKVRLRNRYYCDHCKKSGGSAYHMKQHEAHCTKNPKRTCRMCARLQNDAKPLPELIAFVNSWPHFNTNAESDAAEKQLEAMADGCPACMLAAMAQSNAHGSSMCGLFNFDFEGRMKKALDESEPEREYNYIAGEY